MSELSRIRSEIEGIGYVLKNNLFSVPNYQRAYAWADNNVIDLLRDIASAYRRTEQEYFLGTIVLSSKGAERVDIIDGQQRLVTTVIFLAAVRDYFLAHHGRTGQDLAFDYEREFLVSPHPRTRAPIPRLKMSTVDHGFYHKRILSRPDDPERNVQVQRASHKRIIRAAEIAKDFVQSVVATTNEPTQELINWVHYVGYNTKVMSLTVPSDSNAFTIFETLNVRGRPLDISDKTKNYLFYRSGDRIGEVQNYWISMTGIVAEARIEEFLRQFWSSKHDLTRMDHLYSSIKEEITTQQAAIDLAEEIGINANIYAAILNPSDDFWNSYGPTARESIKALTKDLRMVRVRALLLAILETFPAKEVERALKLIVDWSVRFLMVGGAGGTQEKRYCELAVSVRKGEIKNAIELQLRAQDIVPTDSEFELYAQTASVSIHRLARYYLRTLENKWRGEEGEELVANDNADFVNLEHILPQNPSKAWDVAPEEARAYYQRLGNLALTRRKINSSIGNRGFLEKQPYFQESQLELTNSLANFKNWGIEDINTRQKRLAELAVKAWPNRV